MRVLAGFSGSGYVHMYAQCGLVILYCAVLQALTSLFTIALL
jgi:hypothetical protein